MDELQHALGGGGYADVLLGIGIALYVLDRGVALFSGRKKGDGPTPDAKTLELLAELSANVASSTRTLERVAEFMQRSETDHVVLKDAADRIERKLEAVV